MRRLSIDKAVALVLVVACGGTGASTSTTITTEPHEFIVVNPAILPTAVPGSNGASGSGCAPGEGSLPDGIWFGFATDKADGSVEFDLACWFGGDAANEAAADDGIGEIPVPNDYYIRNENPASRTVPVSPSAVIYSLGETIEAFEHLSLEQWSMAPGSSLACSDEHCLVWLYVNGGSITEIVEQYTP